MWAELIQSEQVNQAGEQQNVLALGKIDRSHSMILFTSDTPKCNELLYCGWAL